MRRTGRTENHIKVTEQYLKENSMFRNYKNSNDDGVVFTGDLLELRLEDVEPCVSGPKRPHD